MTKAEARRYGIWLLEHETGSRKRQVSANVGKPVSHSLATSHSHKAVLSMLSRRGEEAAALGSLLGKLSSDDALRVRIKALVGKK